MHWITLVLLLGAAVPGVEAPSREAGPADGSTAAPAEADALLLRAVLLLYSGADGPARAPGATGLGALGDARAVGPLVQASTDRSLSVRTAALRALARYPTPEAQRALRRAATESDEPQLSKLAVESLAEQGPSGGAVLLQLAGDESASEEVRSLALTRTRERFPELLAAAPPPSDSSGRGLAIVAGALFGSYTLAAIGNLGANQGGPAIGAAGGVLVGGGAALLLTQKVPLSRRQAGTIASAGGWGLATGLVVGASGSPASTALPARSSSASARRSSPAIDRERIRSRWPTSSARSSDWAWGLSARPPGTAPSSPRRRTCVPPRCGWPDCRCRRSLRSSPATAPGCRSSGVSVSGRVRRRHPAGRWRSRPGWRAPSPRRRCGA